MHHLLGPYSDYALTFLRIVAGFLFLCHGAQKFGVIQDPRSLIPLASSAQATQPAWTEQLRLPAGRMLVAGTIEVIGGAFLMVGLLTSSVAFVASGMMAFAYFLAHAPQGFYPLFNRGEPAVLFCFIWLYVATRPPGKFALDNVLFKSGVERHQEVRGLRPVS